MTIHASLDTNNAMAVRHTAMHRQTVIGSCALHKQSLILSMNDGIDALIMLIADRNLRLDSETMQNDLQQQL